MLKTDTNDLGLPGVLSSNLAMDTDMTFSESLAGCDLSFLSADDKSGSTISHHNDSLVSTGETSSCTGGSESPATRFSSGYHRDGYDSRYLTDRQASERLEALSEQLTTLSTRILLTARLITCPSCPPLAVTSPHIEGLFEATNTLAATLHSFERVLSHLEAREQLGAEVEPRVGEASRRL